MRENILGKTFLGIILFSLVLNIAYSQTPPSNISGAELRTWLKENYYDGLHTTLGYDGQNGARSYMYNIIDNREDTVTCVYGGSKVYRLFDLTRSAGTIGMSPINCEHSIPQSFFTALEPMKSDIHHLYTTYQNWNSTRQNFPFADIDDAQTSKWMYLETDQTNIPSSNAELYSEFHSATFEPREDHKGNLARAIFYFYTMYPTEAGDMNLVGDSCVFYQWHLNDTIDALEEQRNEDILLYQGNENPFISNPGLIVRAWDLGNLPPPDLSLEATSSVITLNWGNMPAETGYNVYRSTDSITFTQIGSTLAANTISYDDMTGVAGTKYYYYVTGVYDADESTSGPAISGELAPAIPPTAITDLALSATTSDLELSWTDISTETTYQVYRSSDNISYLPLGSPLAANTVTYTDNTAAVSTNYYYYILANNEHGSSANSNIVNGQLLEGNTAATNLIISEYIEGSSFNKAIEIANFTGASVDLSQYELGKQTNGAGSWNTLSLSGTLPDKSVYVIVNNSATDPTLIAQADLSTSSSVMSFNGNDPVALFDAVSLPMNIIDIVGTEDGGSSGFAKDATLVRDSVITEPNTTYTTTEWFVFAQDEVDSIGAHTMELEAILPVELSVFSGLALDGFYRLEWITASETNNDFFEIQESLDGNQFESIGFVDSDGDSKINQRYEFIVNDPPLKAYYRLRQVNEDGTHSFSNVIALEQQDLPLNLQIWPIPASSFVNVKMETPKALEVELSIFSMAGQRVYTDKTQLQAGVAQSAISLEALKDGFYIIELKTDRELFRTKLIKAQY